MSEELLYAARALLRINGGPLWESKGNLKNNYDRNRPGRLLLNPKFIAQVTVEHDKHLVIYMQANDGAYRYVYPSAEECEQDLMLLQALISTSFGV